MFSGLRFRCGLGSFGLFDQPRAKHHVHDRIVAFVTSRPEHRLIRPQETVIDMHQRGEHGAVFERRLVAYLIWRDPVEAFGDTALLVEGQCTRRGQLRADVHREDDEWIALTPRKGCASQQNENGRSRRGAYAAAHDQTSAARTGKQFNIVPPPADKGARTIATTLQRVEGHIPARGRSHHWRTACGHCSRQLGLPS